VEEVLGALSLLLNGGGVEQLQKISYELNNALAGNEPAVRALLSHVDELATEVDTSKGEIIRAIDGLNRLSGTLVSQTGNLRTALDSLAPGLKVVTEQRAELVGMLQALNKFSVVAVDTVHKSRAQLVANLMALQPLLGNWSRLDRGAGLRAQQTQREHEVHAQPGGQGPPRPARPGR
jgi:phospholipid/cholesterol/gamma-HCH transport system substrate-binding protein